ncbi:DUF2207 domain-containing protein [uncultured Algimonas sp.]|uniref:DUF2207 domain-containing protein n=1 Tax=uncultured Algimonas sp. TaxID=1547920 RepID=UPI002611C4EA|nr:DUF2207 domain-containing protein [uncultured Algimonas sp.]
MRVWLGLLLALVWAALAAAQTPDPETPAPEPEPTLLREDPRDELIRMFEDISARQDAPDPELQNTIDRMKAERDGPVFDPFGTGHNADLRDDTMREAITLFDVEIDVATSGDIVVTETIDLVAAGRDIRRGIFRELPARYTFMGVTLDYDYRLLEVTRDGEPESVTTSYNGNAVTFRLGRQNYFLRPGPYTYRIRYSVADRIRRHDDRDELFWNATGTYFSFPIDRARATVRFPDGATVTDVAFTTGPFGSRAQNARAEVDGGTVTFETTQPLPSRAGLTVSASIAPGVIAPMSAAEKQAFFWIRRGAAILLGLGGAAILLYYGVLWHRIGRDPQKPPVFPRYAPPRKGRRSYSSAAVHYIHHKGFRGFDALSAMLMHLGGQGVLDIEADKTRTTIRQLSDGALHPDAHVLIDALMDGRDGTLVLDGGTDTAFHRGVMKFHRIMGERYGSDYHRHNLGWILLGVLLSVVLAALVFLQPVAKSTPLALGLFAGLLGLNILFFILLPAPTKHGAKVGAEIEGFKLYLETAEKDRLNMADPVSGRPPAMTVELYERFLPYAMALGVEKPWTKQFETSLPREAAEYRPAYAHGDMLSGRGDPVDFTRSLNKTLTSGVAAAAPVSQSSGSGSSSGFSSGSGGGGFSGGGGGGGGGGGW